MTNNPEVRDFLTSRRARVRPEQVDLPGGPGRRVPGLRRGEVAMLAGVSVEYYARIERGELGGVTDVVLEAIAAALRFDESERAHLFDLARTANSSPVRQRRAASGAAALRPSMRFVVDAITDAVAFVQNGRLDIVAANPLCRALYADVFAAEPDQPNFARFNFLHQDRSRRFYTDWDGAADTSVAMLRTASGQNPHDKGLQELIGELSTRSDDFRAKWAKHDVRLHGSGLKTFRHPLVGDVELSFENLAPIEGAGLNLLVYTAEPGSRNAEALQLLANWSRTEAVTGAQS
ncbi:helix-turn-helix transcriptional regulator [Microbacterium sp. M1A1_1b]|uniref:helix-turn-helix transcriptional regulator n=1 Tax=Curtobacterium sp. VKM Ac-2922 TaxID=2929475 RepID=UPI001FB27CA2|nr:helix-turn-helix transcriptional regulator [Curtobacterium sp. VKM Ac-2922]MCJ1714971.1 helix-turn-helix transcriptional regulator [Curtobacterium sp. VKM Ac-2922]